MGLCMASFHLDLYSLAIKEMTRYVSEDNKNGTNTRSY